jgi:predicted RNA-binding Zn-ribbon protein involved in translation (DUF1610 family)
MAGRTRGGNTNVRKLVVVVLAVLISCGVGVALWQYLVCVPVETGAVVTCPICKTVLADEVNTLRVPRWKCNEYRVDRQEMLCVRCANEIIAVHATTVVYCPDCGKQLRTFTATDQVKRADELAWQVEHKWQKETCSRCRHYQLLAKGDALYQTKRYREAKAAFEAAKKAYPESNTPDRRLARIDEAKAQEQWTAAQAAAKADDERRAEARRAHKERMAKVGGTATDGRSAGGVCQTCGGDGLLGTCPKCGGTGCYLVTRGIFTKVTKMETCSTCQGTGHLLCLDCMKYFQY